MTKDDADILHEQILELMEYPNVKLMDTFIQHGDVSCLKHCISVAYFSYRYCKFRNLNIDYRSLVRGAMLHDFFLYDWHVEDKTRKLHGFYHPIQALINAEKEFELTEVERNIIENHMWPLTLFHMPHCREAWIVCMMDKLCSLSETFGSTLFQYSFMSK